MILNLDRISFAAGSSVKQLAQKYFGAAGGDTEERAAGLAGNPDCGLDGVTTFDNRVPGAIAEATPVTFASQVPRRLSLDWLPSRTDAASAVVTTARVELKHRD